MLVAIASSSLAMTVKEVLDLVSVVSSAVKGMGVLELVAETLTSRTTSIDSVFIIAARENYGEITRII